MANEDVKAALEKYGYFTTPDDRIDVPDEQSNFGDLLIWTAARVAALNYSKIIAVVDEEYGVYKYPHTIVVAQNISSQKVTNLSDEVTYPVAVITRIEDDNPFRAMRILTAHQAHVVRILRRTPDVEPIDLPERGSHLNNVKVMSAPILRTLRSENEYEAVVRVEYIVREPRLDEGKYFDDS